jgi:hypothetical protein
VTDELIRNLARLQRRTADLEKLINSAHAAAPEHSTGMDSSGMIAVTLGADGLPQSFRVARHWRRRLVPENIGHAVFEAFQAALAERMNAWSGNLAEQRWRERFDEHRASPPLSSTPDRAEPGTSAPALPGPGIAPRSVDAVAEDVIKALDEAGQVAAAIRQPTGTGSDESGMVVLTLSGSGLVSCAVDARWAPGRTAVMLAKALSQALVAARTDLGRQAEGPRATDVFGGVAAEALALLTDRHRGTNS